MVATISTGEPSTLKTYRRIAEALTGPGSKAVQFLDQKIRDQGEEAEVIQHESQMLILIMQLSLDDLKAAAEDESSGEETISEEACSEEEASETNPDEGGYAAETEISGLDYCDHGDS
jgi:hypothetical protein